MGEMLYKWCKWCQDCGKRRNSDSTVGLGLAGAAIIAILRKCLAGGTWPAQL
jgi:hypothetical protein